MTGKPDQNDSWDEKLSREFIDYGRYFIPERQHQIDIIVSLLPKSDTPSEVIELCCGEGHLAEAILDCNLTHTVLGFDGSNEMLLEANKRLTRFGPRFQSEKFDLRDRSWRKKHSPVETVVSSLAIHHLTGPEKEIIYSDIFKMLKPGGVFIIADVIDPVHPISKRLAADEYDAVVMEQSQKIDGNLNAFKFFKNEGWNFFHYLDPEDIDKPSPLWDQMKWLEKAGFRDLDIFWLRAGHAIFGGWVPST